MNYLLKGNVSITSTSFTISGAQLKEAGYKKVIDFYSVQYLVMRVTFCVFTCNSRMVQLKMAVKTSEIYSNKGDFWGNSST